MNNEHIYVVIMAGGVGSRLWPLSRKKHPKQFHDFLGTGKSLIRLTYERHLPLCRKENILVVTNADYHSLVKEHLPELKDDQILLEPEGRNTAPCVAYATYKVCCRDENAVFVICPADHLITNEGGYLDNLRTAAEHAQSSQALVTLGIRPTRPDTGYGYIRFQAEGNQPYPVKAFTEKPDIEKAKTFLESGDYVWNAGIFIWSGKTIQQAFASLLPQQHELFGSGKINYFTENEQQGVDEAYRNSESISIDYGIMEKADNVYTVLSNFNWSDLGTWGSVYEESDKDENGNVRNGEVVTYDVKDSMLRTSSGKLMVVHGLKNVIVIDSDDVLMILPKDDEQKVKQFVEDASKNTGDTYI